MNICIYACINAAQYESKCMKKTARHYRAGRIRYRARVDRREPICYAGSTGETGRSVHAHATCGKWRNPLR